jgi:hypothetical protein
MSIGPAIIDIDIKRDKIKRNEDNNEVGSMEVVSMALRKTKSMTRM